ncbi:protein rep [Vagococcus carniphilus]|uniref:protein rep n=1 Tax=Vagococcus carniphilus TaxID=218144 RepID=UPI003B5AF53D
MFKKNYLSKAEWLATWCEVTEQPEITQVEVKRVKQEEKDSAVTEMAKYVAKDSDYLLNQEIFETFFSSLKHKRLIVYAEIMKNFAKRYAVGK